MEFRHFRGKLPPRFVNAAERELAELLDEAGLPWEYEPHTFPLAHDEDGRLLEAVTPDFYLPDAGLYIECTEMRPRLAHRKRRKLRKLRALYGEMVTLVGRREFDQVGDVGRVQFGDQRPGFLVVAVGDRVEHFADELRAQPVLFVHNRVVFRLNVGFVRRGGDDVAVAHGA